MKRSEVDAAVKVALQALGNKKTDSIRKACKVAGITPTTLYNKTTDAEREAARAGKYKPSVEAAPVPKKRGRPAQKRTNPSIFKDIDRNSPEYVAKLERFALKRILEEE